jgi:hypothetical protein
MRWRRSSLEMVHRAISFALRATAPHPTAAEELVTMRTKSYSRTP